MHLVIIGYGDIGARVAALEIARGRQVTACGRHPETHVVEGVQTQPLDLDTLTNDYRLPENVSVYYFAPPPAEGRQDTRIRAWLEAVSRGSLPKRLVYISTTGVYGDCHGEWIDETRTLNPETDRSHRRLDAEQCLQSWAKKHGVELVVLRVAGIYGPGRLPVARIKQGMRVLRESDSGFSNRIHADDLAEICVAAMERAENGEIFNVSDGHPSTMRDYFCQVAVKFGLPMPEEISWETAQQSFSPAMLSYLRESKRIDNRRLRERLDVELRYPTLADGLKNS